MQVIDTEIEDVKLIQLDVFADERGAFAETYDTEKFAKLGLAQVYVQDSWSLSRRAGTVRGLHFQLPPRAQHKIVRVTRGRILDVIVDIRSDSPSFGRHVEIELSAARAVSVYVPIGFAHGFCTLEDDTEVTYKMSDHYVPSCYRGILWSDPQLSIPWPVKEDEAQLSQQDRLHPRLAELPRPSLFTKLTNDAVGSLDR